MDRLLRASALIAASVVAARVVNLGFRFLVAREVPVAEYGRIALLLVTANLAAQVGAWNLGNAAARYTAGSGPARGVGRRIGGLAMVTGTAAAVGCGIVVWRLGDSWTVAIVLGVGVLAYALESLAEGFLRAFGANWPQALGILVTALTRLLLLAVAVVVLGSSVTSLPVAAAFASGSVVAAAVVIPVARRAFRSAPRQDCPTVVPLTSWLRFGGVLTASSVVTLGLGFANRLLLRGTVGLEDVAHYDNALLAYSALQAFLSAFVSVSIPAYAAAGPQAAVRVARLGRMLVPFVAAWLGLFVAHRAGLSDAAFRIAGVPDYAGMFPVLLVVLLAFPFELLFVSISGALQARDRVFDIGAASCIAAVVGLGVAWAAIPHIGVAGAAVSTVSSAVILAVAAAYLRRAHGMRLERR